MHFVLSSRTINRSVMSLSPKELSSLLNILSEENVRQHSFETISTNLQSVIAKNDNFKIGCCLVHLLQLPDLLPSSSQKLAAIYLLYDMYKNEMLSLNPFAPIFIHLLSQSEAQGQQSTGFRFLPRLSAGERNFLYCLISGNLVKEVLKKSPIQIIQTEVTNLPPVDISELQLALAGHYSELPMVSRCGVPAIVSDPDRRPTLLENGGDVTSVQLDVQRRVIEEMCCGSNPLSMRSLRPQFMRIAPPPYFSDSDLIFVGPPIDQHEFTLDASMCSDERNREAENKRLLARAVREPLPAPTVEQLVEELNKSPHLVQAFGMTPAKLPNLIQSNPLLAIEFMKKMVDSPMITDYFNILFNMEMSLQSLDVVNRLTGDMSLPSEFLHMYISNCISTCETIADKSLQNRYVRLVCVFLQSLIRNKAIDVREIFIDVQAFCIEFSRIREAAMLFRLLKSLGNDSAISATLSSVDGSTSDTSGLPGEPLQSSSSTSSLKDS